MKYLLNILAITFFFVSCSKEENQQIEISDQQVSTIGNKLAD